MLNYFNQNYDNLHRIINAEVDVSVEKPGYILDGKIDLLIGEDGKLELLDFKSQKKLKENSPMIRRLLQATLHLCAYLKGEIRSAPWEDVTFTGRLSRIEILHL